MTATVKYVLRTHRKNSSNESPLYIRLTYKRKTNFVKFGLSLHEKDWNKEKQRVRRSHPSYKKLNHELDRIFTKIQQVKLELSTKGQLNIGHIVNILKGYDSKDFFIYGDEYIKRLENTGSIRLAKQTKVIINKIKRFHKSDSLALNQFDNKFLSDLKGFLLSEIGNAPNTVRKDFVRLRRLFDEAVKDKLLNHNPIENVDLPSRQQSNKAVLSLSQIKAIENLNLPHKSSLWHTRNYFLYSFYNAGIRIGDLMKLKRKNLQISGDEIRLKYLMNKTKQNSQPKWKNLKQLPQAVKILEMYSFRVKKPEEYIFPILNASKNLENPGTFDLEKQSKTTIINKNLKKIGSLAGIEENISSHVARHSFANYARKKGMSLYSISKALAHSTLKTTEQYLKSFDEEMLDGEMENLFE